jgi:hypothetical protein
MKRVRKEEEYSASKLSLHMLLRLAVISKNENLIAVQQDMQRDMPPPKG